MHRRLVLIHPDSKLAAIYKNSLSKYFQVDSASDGLSGLRMIRSMLPDLVVSEFEMPNISGLGLLRFVREHPDLHGIPFLFLSKQAPVYDSLGLGATEWLVLSQTNPETVAQKCFNHLKIKTYV